MSTDSPADDDATAAAAAAESVPEGTTGMVVTHEEAAHRYVGRLDGEVVALVDYVPQGGALAVVHTEVVPAHENQGLATQLVTEALEDVRRRGLRVVPVCPFVRMHVRRHAEEYADIL